MGEWINVKNRLPGKDGRYRVKAILGSMSPKEIERTATFKTKGWPRFLEQDWETVTHWQQQTDK